MALFSTEILGLSISLFLNYDLFDTIAVKNMNVMDVIKAWFH